jgi:hypothetical protein
LARARTPIAAPMVNEVALGLLFALVGWKVAAIYLGFGLAVAIVSGWMIGRLHLEHWLEAWVRDLRSASAELPSARIGIVDRLQAGVEAIRDIVFKVWPWIIVGIAIGALIHGYVPAGAMAKIMNRDAWWSCQPSCSPTFQCTPTPPASFPSSRP